LAAVLASTPNILILDEPTNDLDLSTVEVLEEMLSSYRGLLLVVSHDRSFMEGATEDLLVLPGDGTAQRYQGTYSDYLRDQQKRHAAQEQQRRYE
jgi:ATP-binding cassette subfamily F protein uup